MTTETIVKGEAPVTLIGRVDLSASSNAPALEIQLSLTNGQIYRFGIDDAVAAQRFLGDIKPARLFADELIMVGGDSSTSIIPTSSIERIDFIADELPTWPYLGGAKDVLEVSPAKFREAYDSKQYAESRLAAAKDPGSEQIGYTEYWTASGQQNYWQVRMMSTALTSMDFRPYIQKLMSSNGLHARTGNGGVCVLNPANLTRLTFHPGPSTIPPGAWAARRL
ncbi:MAG TPA: hypothetical protein VGK19_07360 [Capsulimonadaceae bacterium]|jgi:hypothetical protein